jgi:thiol-disulfide isomerase/thioredoxin
MRRSHQKRQPDNVGSAIDLRFDRWRDRNRNRAFNGGDGINRNRRRRFKKHGSELPIISDSCRKDNFVRFLLTLLIAAAAFASENPVRPAQDRLHAQDAKRERPPDVKAYTEASRMRDPEKRITALEKWKRDFPASDMRDAAEEVIFETLVKHLPKQTVRIRQQAKVVYAREKDAGANVIAVTLVDADLLIKDAERYAKKGVKALDESQYVAEQKASFAKRKQTAPPEKELRKRFAERRAASIATLGRVYAKRGRTAEGRKLLEEAYAVRPTLPGVAGTLGELAAKSGDDSKAMEYLIATRLSGRASKESLAVFDAVYRKTHGGSLDGVEAMLDAEYRKRFPNSVHVERYQPTAKRTGRVVLGEVFTGSGCPPCSGADRAFDAVMERYSHAELAVIMYHLHIPRADPMTNPDTQSRQKEYGVNAVPTWAIDGVTSTGGGTSDIVPVIFKRLSSAVDKELETPAEAQVKLSASRSDNFVSVRGS